MKSKIIHRNLRCRRNGGRFWRAYMLAGEGAWLAVWGQHYTEAADGIQDRGDEWVALLRARGELS